MINSSDSRPVLSRLAPGQFLGREVELERVCSFTSRGGGVAALLLGAPRVGKTELLRTAFDRLFTDQGRLAPVYHPFDRGRLIGRPFAVDYLSQFLACFVAFRRNDPALIDLAMEPLEQIAREAPPEDCAWIRMVIDGYRRAVETGDSRLALQRSLSAPSIAATHTSRAPLVMFDNLRADAAEPELIRSLLTEAMSQTLPARVGYVFCGLSRPLLESIPAESEAFAQFDLIQAEPLAETITERLIRAIACELAVEVSDPTIDLMMEQLAGDLFYVRAVLDAAAARKASLRTFLEFERVYTEELLRGRIFEYLNSLVRDAGRGRAGERAALEALSSTIGAGAPVPRDLIVERLAADTRNPEEVLGRLHAWELVTMTAGFVEPSTDPVLADYVRARYRREVGGGLGPIAGNELLGEKLKQSHRLVVSRFNKVTETRLIDLLSRFDCQNVPASLFDHATFERLFRGMNRVGMRRSIESHEERIRLPQVVSVEDAGSEQRLGITCRLFVVNGFDGGIYAASNQALWLVALINSNEPLDLETLGRLERRFELKARTAVDGSIVRWYVSKAGFSAAALDRLAELRAHSSGYSELDLLADYVAGQASAEEVKPVSEFELIIPIEEESELIAARTAEQIARAASFEQEAINQIKTALIEACLNAAEHGDSPDRRIYNRFAVAEDRISISVSNRGRQLGFIENGNERGAKPKGRGRGLQIIRALMDEVRFERDEGGTTLVMVKLLNRS